MLSETALLACILAEPDQCHSFINFLLGSGRRACILCGQTNLSSENRWVFLLSRFPLNATLPTVFSFEAARGVYFKADWAIPYSVVFKAKAQVPYQEVNNVVK